MGRVVAPPFAHYVSLGYRECNPLALAVSTKNTIARLYKLLFDK